MAELLQNIVVTNIHKISSLKQEKWIKCTIFFALWRFPPYSFTTTLSAKQAAMRSTSVPH